ncbi:MAG: hypothetical protein ACRDWG_17575 [Actinomycetes bacterium]
MSCEHLVCANCSGPVSEARCSVCRAGRAEVHGPLGHLTSYYVTMAGAVALLLLLLVLLVSGRAIGATAA